MLARPEHKPKINIHVSNELPLSNLQFIEIMKAVLGKGYAFKFRASGVSMYPLIKSDDVLTLIPVINNHISIGDVIAFINPTNGRLYVHRLIYIRGNYYAFKGDNSSTLDFVPYTNIIGKVSKVVRNTKDVHFGLGIEKYVITLMSIIKYLIHFDELAYTIRTIILKVHHDRK